MKNLVTPAYELHYARESFASSLAQGMSHASDFTKKLKDLMPSIIRGFAPSKEIATLPKIENISKEQTQFLKILKDIPYTELRERPAQTPEAMRVSYLEFLQVLLPVTRYIKDIEARVIRPYVFFLAQMVSDTKGALTTNSYKKEYAALIQNRDKAYSDFSPLYTPSSTDSARQVKDVVQRNSDWSLVLPQLNECVNNMQAIDLESIKSQVQQCSDYLDILHAYLQENKLQATSLEAAQALSEGAWQVAQELQFMSTTHYRVLALNGCVENTISNITQALG
jgi:hypothetical protein